MFNFITDNESEEYCLEIVQAILDTYKVSQQEAIDLVNLQWQGETIIGEDDWIYHDSPIDWAKRIHRRHKEGKGW
jgi:hypothetical protein